jgi:hypothetical protein
LVAAALAAAAAAIIIIIIIAEAEEDRFREGQGGRRDEREGQGHVGHAPGDHGDNDGRFFHH